MNFPTILVAVEDDRVGVALIRDLQQQGYFVLVARDAAQAIETARLHSRPIHLMVTSENTGGRKLEESLKPYRQKMQVLFITHSDEDALDLSGFDAIVAKVRALLEPPAKPAKKLVELRPQKSSYLIA